MWRIQAPPEPQHEDEEPQQRPAGDDDMEGRERVGTRPWSPYGGEQ